MGCLGAAAFCVTFCLGCVAVTGEMEVPASTSSPSKTATLKPVQSAEDLRICGSLMVRRKQLSGKYIHGVGVEIGAKHTPLPVDRRGNVVIYVDHKDDEGLTEQFGDAPSGHDRLHVDVVDDGTAEGDWAPYPEGFVHATFATSS